MKKIKKEKRNRLTEKTPKFFKRIRNISIAIAATGTAILAAPVALPVALVTLAGYLVAIGSVATAVAQSVTTNEKEQE